MRKMTLAAAAAAAIAWSPLATAAGLEYTTPVDRALQMMQNGDTVDGVIEMKRLADQGNPDAQYLSGLIAFKTGQADLGAKWLRRSAEQGHRRAAFTLGRAYLDGDPVKKDVENGRGMLRKAADAGFFRAQVELARSLLPSEERADRVEAVKWLKVAEASSRARLGILEGDMDKVADAVPGFGGEARAEAEKRAEKSRADMTEAEVSETADTMRKRIDRVRGVLDVAERALPGPVVSEGSEAAEAWMSDNT